MITSCYRDDGARNDDDGDDDCDDETTHIPVRVFKSASRIQSFLSPLTRRHAILLLLQKKKKKNTG